jgi:hypothetical protein
VVVRSGGLAVAVDAIASASFAMSGQAEGQGRALLTVAYVIAT